MGLFINKSAGFYAQRKDLFIVLALFIIGLAIYSNILLAPFIFDDGVYILKNAKLYDLTNFLAVPWNRYMTYLTFAINLAIGGYNPFDFHLTNVVIHVFNSIWLYYLVLTVLKTPLPKKGFEDKPVPAWTIACAAALLFLAHPVQTQAVSYVTQRFTSLAAFFYLSSVLCYARHRLDGRGVTVFYILSLGLGACAQLSKEISFTLPVMIILYEFLFIVEGVEGGVEGKDLRKRLLRLAPFLLLFFIIPFTFLSETSGAAGAGIADMVRKEQLRELTAFSRYEYLVTQFSVIVHYLRLFIWPAGQRLIYDYPRYQSFFEPAVIFSFALISAFLGVSVYLFARSRKAGNGAGMLFGFGVVWFFVTLSIESSLVPIKDVIFEHRAYLPNAGLAVSASAAAYYLAVTYLKRPASGRVFGAAVIAAVVALSVATYKRNIVWGNPLALWLDNYNKAPDSTTTIFNLGYVYNSIGEYEKSVEHFKRVLKTEPDNTYVLINIVGPLLRLEKLDEAESYAKRAAVLLPNSVNTHINLGVIAFERGDYKKAAARYRMALKIDPKNLLAGSNLASVYYLMNDYDNVIAQYEALLKIYPAQPDVHFLLGKILLEKKGRRQEAAGHFRDVLRFFPGNRQAEEELERITNDSRKGK